jgi:ATP-dependent Clp protease adaptor protein ClpS
MSEEVVIEEVVEEVEEKKDKKKKGKTKPKPMPQYAIMLHNDDFHTFYYVIDILKKICHRNIEDSIELTKQIHMSGLAMVWTGNLEVAELKKEQITNYGPDDYAPKPISFPLGVSIEKLPG